MTCDRKRLDAKMRSLAAAATKESTAVLTGHSREMTSSAGGHLNLHFADEACLHFMVFRGRHLIGWRMPLLLSLYTGAYGASVVGVRGTELGAVNAPNSSVRNSKVEHGEDEEIS